MMGVQTSQAEIVRVRQLTPEVREMVLHPLEQKISFKPGQWVSLHLPVGEKPPLVRAYSMAEPEVASGNLVLVFDRVPRGMGSGYLFSVKEGDRIPVTGPYGKFVLPDPLDRELLLVARYTGIVPIHCLIKHLFTRERLQKVTLIYSAASSGDFIYHEEFLELAALHSSFRYVPPLLSGKEQCAAGCRHETEVIESLFSDRKDYLPMVCGVRSFVEPLRAFFSEKGFGRREVRHETYD